VGEIIPFLLSPIGRMVTSVVKAALAAFLISKGIDGVIVWRFLYFSAKFTSILALLVGIKLGLDAILVAF